MIDELAVRSTTADRGHGVGVRADLHLAGERRRGIGSGASPAQVKREPAISAIASASFGPTTTVFSFGRTSSTKRGLPSGAGVPRCRPRRWPTV